MADEIQTPDPIEADEEMVANTEAPVNDDSESNSSKTGDDEEAEVSEATSEDSIGSIPSASNVVTLFFSQPVSVSINGKTFESEAINPSEHALTIPTNLEESVRQNLFDAHEITPEE